MVAVTLPEVLRHSVQGPESCASRGQAARRQVSEDDQHDAGCQHGQERDGLDLIEEQLFIRMRQYRPGPTWPGRTVSDRTDAAAFSSPHRSAKDCLVLRWRSARIQLTGTGQLGQVQLATSGASSPWSRV